MSDRDPLSSLLEALQARLGENLSTGAPRDAIDEVLASPPRTTGVRPLVNHEAVRRFREELAAGAIGADTANGLLKLIGTILAASPT